MSDHLASRPLTPKQDAVTQQAAERPLTVKQQRWAEEYARTGNGVQAARVAGYKGNEATLASVSAENLRKVQLVSALGTIIRPAQLERIASAEERQAHLSAIIRGEHQATHITKAGIEQGPPTHADQIRASELLAKMRGDLAPIKLDITARIHTTTQVWVAQVLSVIEQESGTDAAQRILDRLPVLELEAGK
jgi:phage terminase small subunit